MIVPDAALAINALHDLPLQVETRFILPLQVVVGVSCDQLVPTVEISLKVVPLNFEAALNC